jgi:HD-like signal output (HDOD) protein
LLGVLSTHLTEDGSVQENAVGANSFELTEAAASPLAAALAAILHSDQCELPVLPEAAAQLLRMTADVNCEITDVIGVIKRDQSLTGHLLRIANSARYSNRVTVTSIQQAVARLGLLTIRQIVVLISCQCRVFDVPGFEADVRRSFKRSLAAAAVAQEVARARRLNVEEAFLCGLLHDVGRPVLLQALLDSRRGGLVCADDDLLAAAETHRVEIAGRLVTSWELPARVAEVIRHQQTPLDSAQCRDSAAVLNLSIDLAGRLLSEEPMSDQNIDSHPMLSVLNLYPEQLKLVLGKRDEILEWVKSSV